MILSRPIKTGEPAGNYFPDWLLEMIYSLSEEKIYAIDNNLEKSWFWNRHNCPISIQIKLTKILAKSESNLHIDTALLSKMKLPTNINLSMMKF